MINYKLFAVFAIILTILFSTVLISDVEARHEADGDQEEGTETEETGGRVKTYDITLSLDYTEYHEGDTITMSSQISYPPPVDGHYQIYNQNNTLVYSIIETLAIEKEYDFTLIAGNNTLGTDWITGNYTALAWYEIGSPYPNATASFQYTAAYVEPEEDTEPICDDTTQLELLLGLLISDGLIPLSNGEIFLLIGGTENYTEEFTDIDLSFYYYTIRENVEFNIDAFTDDDDYSKTHDMTPGKLYTIDTSIYALGDLNIFINFKDKDTNYPILSYTGGFEPTNHDGGGGGYVETEHPFEEDIYIPNDQPISEFFFPG